MQNSKLQVKIKNLINKNNIDAIIISSVPDIIYLTNYAGFSEIEREAYLLITKKTQYIFTDGRYATAIKKEVPHFVLQEISGATPFPSLLQTIVKKEKIQTIGFEAANLTVLEYTKIRPVAKRVKAVDLRAIRLKKTKNEIAAIKKACNIGDKVYRYIETKLQSGMTEKEVALQMELYAKRLGASLSFPTIVAFGKNSAIPHHHTGKTKLKLGDFVLFDFGMKVDNYCSDMTRTLVFGTPSDTQKHIWKTVLTAQKVAIGNITAMLKKNHKVEAAKVDRDARDFIVKEGYPSIPHSLGHGIGIEVHEAPTLSPKSKDLLEEGMVFSIEPGVYLPDFGGVRIEDLFVIQNGRLKQLTSSPKNISSYF